jgi:hypothetical protein
MEVKAYIQNLLKGKGIEISIANRKLYLRSLQTTQLMQN